MVAALVLALVVPARGAGAGSVDATTLEGVTCPGSVGPYKLHGGTALTLGGGTRQLDCSYWDGGPAGGRDLTLVAGWIESAGSSAGPSGTCGMPHTSDDVVSTTHLAIASYLTGDMFGGTPPAPAGSRAANSCISTNGARRLTAR